MIQVKVEYTFKGKRIKATETTSDESMVNTYIDLLEEDIRQHITEHFLDQCVGWEKAMELEHKELDKFDKKKKITIKR